MGIRALGRGDTGDLWGRKDALMSTTYLPPEAQAVIGGYHADPFRYLGPHQEGGRNIVRAFLPGAEQVIVVDQANHHDELQRIDDAGLFSGEVTSDLSDYRL